MQNTSNAMKFEVIGYSHLGCYKINWRIEQEHRMSRIGFGLLGFDRRLDLEDERQLCPNEAGAFGDDGRGMRLDWMEAAKQEAERFAVAHTEQWTSACPVAQCHRALLLVAW